MDRIIKEDITGATHARCSVEKAKGTIMRWFVQRRDSEQLLQKSFFFFFTPACCRISGDLLKVEFPSKRPGAQHLLPECWDRESGGIMWSWSSSLPPPPPPTHPPTHLHTELGILTVIRTVCCHGMDVFSILTGGKWSWASVPVALKRGTSLTAL